MQMHRSFIFFRNHQSKHIFDCRIIEAELDSNWEVLGEPIQTAMRACP